ncbi:MAG: hypothetical protein E7Z85_06655 [Methanosphaera stadtmanae]|nr:hypothetical protein [Methanosphaera stadtmanae]
MLNKNSDINIYKKSHRTTINVDESEFNEYYQSLTTNTNYFKNNIHLFTIAALIGKFIIKERKPIEKQNTYFRYADNASTDEMQILKALAIMEVDDINILIDHDEMFKICEEYARTGIKQLFKWYNDKNIDFNVELLTIINNFYKNDK